MSNADTSLRPRPGETAEQTIARVVAAVTENPRFPVEDEQEPEAEK